MSECVTGYIDHIIFRNEDNGYTVMVLKGVKDEDELTCVGTFPVITQGASIEAEGSFIQHPVYGKQFQAVRLTEKMPEDAMAMERYLGSGAIKDYIVDMGPEGGDCGGTVVATGTPEEIAGCPDSYTGQYVAKYLK